MVRSRARLLESDDPATTRARISEMVAEHVPDETERRRIEPALLALLGVGEAPAGGASELFSAWRTFFERLAATGVVALLFEDLQWADPGTLDFIEHMLEWSRNVPILIITLARPELLERRPGWGAGKRAFLALDLQPLDEPSMRQLLAGLAPAMPESTIRSIVARAEGIPLYAVETIRMLVADGRLVERSGGGYEPAGELGDLAVPNTLHALIAARLDGLDPADRVLVQDAAVLGQSFRLDAVAAVVGTDPSEIGSRLERLVRQDLLRQEVDPRSPERGQFAFVQALIREVAYATLSLRDRRARHLAAARHFEAVGDEELAGALAAHYVAAFRASAEGPEADALAGQARISLRAAADRATALGAPGQAVTFLEQAIELTADADDRAVLHEQAGRAALDSARADVALAHYEAATAIWVAVGDRSSQARTVAWEGQALSMARLRDEGLARLAAAWEQLRDLGADDPNLVLLERGLAGMYMVNGDYERANALADQALASAERLGLADIAAEALVVMGTTAFYRGRQWQARALLTGARLLAEEANLADTALRIMITLPSFVALDDPRASLALQQEAIELARRLGRRGCELAILFNATEDARRTGDWEWAVRELGSSLQLDVDETSALGTRGQLAFFDIYRGRGNPGQIEELASALSALEDRDMHSAVDDFGGSDAHARGRWGEAATAWMRIADISDLNAPYALPRAGRVAILARDPALAQAALDRLAALGTRGRAVDADRTTIRAGLAALAGDLEAARAGYRAALRRLPGPGPRVGRGARGPGGCLDARRGRPRDRGLGRCRARHVCPAGGGTHACAARSGGGRGRRRPRRSDRDCGDRCRGIGRRRGPLAQLPQLRQDVPGEVLHHARVPDVAQPEDHVLRAGVRQLAEAVDHLLRALARHAVERKLHGLERGPLDLVGVPPDRRAVLADDLVLVVDRLGAAEDVGRVRVLGDEAQGLPLAATADHDRRVGT